jgi:hypothetical protein
MPEDNKTEKMVDIDTSGPSVDIELKDDTTKETPEVDTETSADISASVPAAEKKEASEKKPEAHKEDKNDSEKEIDDYSEGVQRRIAKLTKKMREAERQKDEALRWAQAVKAEQDNLKQKYSNLETSSIKEREAKISAALQAAKGKMQAAREQGDIGAEIEVSKEIARLGYEEARLQEYKNQASVKQTQQPVVAPQTTQPQFPNIPQDIPTDAKAEEWASKNKWFGADKAMTYTAFDLHKTLVDEEGYDPKSDDYYKEIDKRIRLEFPHKFDTNVSTESTRPTQTVAGAKRSVKTSRKTVRLTPSQVTIAKKLGVPLEEYAKQLNITKEV